MSRAIKPLRALLRTLGLTALGFAVLAPAAQASAITPPAPESPNASDVESAYVVALVVFIVLVVVVNAALIVAVARFRRRRTDRVQARPRRSGSQLRLGTALGVPLATLAAALFTIGAVFTVRASDVEPSGPDGLQAASSRTAQLDIAPPIAGPDPLTIDVSGQQWLWRYGYPDGTFSYYEMVVPVDTTVMLELNSTDVVHRWWVPALGGKFDVVPGQANRTWFKAEREGVFDGQSAAFSGPGYATMRARVRVVSTREYNDWLSQQASDIQAAQEAVREQVESGTVPGLGSLE